MLLFSIEIKGTPYCRSKALGNTNALKVWTQTVIDQTKHLPKVKGACKLTATFKLPKDKFPADYPYGPDLDNLLKRFQDALNETIFSEVKGKDSCIVELNVKKEKVKDGEEPGVVLVISHRSLVISKKYPAAPSINNH